MNWIFFISPEIMQKCSKRYLFSLETLGKWPFPFWLLPRGKCIIKKKLNVKTLTRPYTEKDTPKFLPLSLSFVYVGDTNWRVELGISNIANYKNSLMCICHVKFNIIWIVYWQETAESPNALLALQVKKVYNIPIPYREIKKPSHNPSSSHSGRKIG